MGARGGCRARDGDQLSRAPDPGGAGADRLQRPRPVEHGVRMGVVGVPLRPPAGDASGRRVPGPHRRAPRPGCGRRSLVARVGLARACHGSRLTDSAARPSRNLRGAVGPRCRADRASVVAPADVHRGMGAPILAFGMFWAPKFLVARYGISQGEVARYSFFPPLAFDLGAIAFGDLASRARRRSAARSETALVLVASSLGLAIGWMAVPAAPWPAVSIAAVVCFGIGGALAMSNAGALLAIPRSAGSRASAMTTAPGALGAIGSNPLIGWAVDRTGSYTLALWCLGLLVLPGTAAWLLLGRRSPLGLDRRFRRTRPLPQNDVFHAIAHPVRRTILLLLRDGEKPARASMHGSTPSPIIWIESTAERRSDVFARGR